MVPLSSSTPPPVINHGSSSTAGAAPTRFRIQGYDPLLIVAQIISLQSLHYLTLLLLLPPVLSIVANPRLLDYEGGPRNIALLMDWRSFTGRALVEGATSRAGRAAAGTLVALGHDTNSRGAVLGIGAHEIRHGLRRVVEDDAARGWCVAFCWTMTSMIDVAYLYHLIRRPTHILDFALTLLFSHILLTTYYSSTFPTSLFYWSILISSTVAQVVLAEQWCVRREMREGFGVESIAGGRGRPDEEIELGSVKSKVKRERGVSYDRVSTNVD